MIEIFAEPLIQYGAAGITLLYFMYKDYKVTPKLIEGQTEMSKALLKVALIIDERLPK